MSDESNYVRAQVYANVYAGMVFRLTPQELKAGWAYYHAHRHAESAAKDYDTRFPSQAPAPQAAATPQGRTVVVDMKKTEPEEDGVLGKIDPSKEAQIQEEFLAHARAARGE